MQDSGALKTFCFAINYRFIGPYTALRNFTVYAILQVLLIYSFQSFSFFLDRNNNDNAQVTF